MPLKLTGFIVEVIYKESLDFFSFISLRLPEIGCSKIPAMYQTFQIQLKLVFLLASFTMVVSCLITNCPKGGKRSDEESTLYREFLDSNSKYFRCIPCGPDNQGICLGKNICCGEQIGCLTSPRHIKTCRNIRNYQSTCVLELKRSCGVQGQCKADYLCCSKDQCTFDISCKSASSRKLKDVFEASMSTYNDVNFDS